jgi:hypothetical protein
MGRTAEAKEALEKAIRIAPAEFDSWVRGYVLKRHPGLRPEVRSLLTMACAS